MKLGDKVIIHNNTNEKMTVTSDDLQKTIYNNRAIYAFPYLVAALQEILACYPLSRSMVNTIDHALAIAHGESKE